MIHHILYEQSSNKRHENVVETRLVDKPIQVCLLLQYLNTFLNVLTIYLQDHSRLQLIHYLELQSLD